MKLFVTIGTPPSISRPSWLVFTRARCISEIGDREYAAGAQCRIRHPAAASIGRIVSGVNA